MNPKTFIARKLRHNLTEAEKYLWYILRSKEIMGHKFRRQSPIGSYFVDFVSFEKKLIVELDGGQHFDSKEDKDRDIWFVSQGFIVLRFWNNEVLENREAVIAEIKKYL